MLAGNRRDAFNMAGVHVATNLVNAVVQTVSAAGGVLLGLHAHRAFVAHFHNLYFSHKGNRLLPRFSRVLSADGYLRFLCSALRSE